MAKVNNIDFTASRVDEGWKLYNKEYKVELTVKTLFSASDQAERAMKKILGKRSQFNVTYTIDPKHLTNPFTE